MIDYHLYERVAGIIRNSDVMVVTAGAGIGVDSGLPDFRGDHGFWNAYPMYEQLGLSFTDAANPIHFKNDPEFGWGFYGHRLGLYRDTVPHKGFHIIQDWCLKNKMDYFVVTSNVDGQFQKAGYNPNRIYEIHGSIHHLQCLTPCSDAIWKNDESITIEYETMKSQNVPVCRSCGGVARPNILMFGDYSWLAERTHAQSARFDYFMEENVDKNIVVIEMGAGTSVPSIRFTSERLSSVYGATVVRINPRESFIDGECNVSISDSALKTLEIINDLLD